MPTPVSPKVSAPLWAGLIASVLLANIALVTPDMLSWLGPWAPFAYGCAFTALGAVVGYGKRDPLRDLGSEAAAAGYTPGAPAAAGRHAAIPGTVLPGAAALDALEAPRAGQ